MTVTPYLTFNGNTREAMEFYKATLGGEFITDQSFGDSPMDAPPGHEDKVMHIHYKSGDLELMASDGMPDHKVDFGNNVQLSINLSEGADVDRLFAALSAGGVSVMEPNDTFWGARFAMCIDKFGINWMLNANNK